MTIGAVVLAAGVLPPVGLAVQASAAPTACPSPDTMREPGTFSCTVPDGVTQVNVLVVGGGGAGGNGGGAWLRDDYTDGHDGGGGGGGGGGVIVSCVLPVEAGQVITVTVDEGGKRDKKVGIGTNSGGATTAGESGGDGGSSTIAVAGKEKALAAGGFGGEGGKGATSEGKGAQGLAGVGGPKDLSFCSGDSTVVTAGRDATKALEDRQPGRGAENRAPEPCADRGNGWWGALGGPGGQGHVARNGTYPVLSSGSPHGCVSLTFN